MRCPSLSFVIVLLPACGSTPSVEEPLDEGWLGAAEHFRVLGTLDGEDLDIDGAAELSCVLEWDVPGSADAPDYDAGRMVEIKIEGRLDERRFELELKRHDFQSDAEGATIAIVPRDDEVDPGPGEAWLEWEWHSLDGEDLYEQAAASGSIELGQLTGEVDETGLVLSPETGAAGAWIDARWSPTESLLVSFTAPCTESNVEYVE